MNRAASRGNAFGAEMPCLPVAPMASLFAMKADLLFLADNWGRLLPDAAQLLQGLALLAVAAGFVAIGAAIRLLARDAKAALEADLLVGWSVVAVAFTVLGTFTAIPFTAVAAVAAAAAVAAGALLVLRRQPLLPPGGGKMVLLLLPLLLATLSMLPSENDDVAQWLPNLRYLMVVDRFPGPGLPASDSALPAYPYAVTLIGYLAGKLSGTLADTAIDRFNLLLSAALALLLVQVFRGRRDARPVGWGEAAVALAFVTLLAPAFVAKLVLSNYADCATSVALAFSAVLAVRLLADDDSPGRGGVIQLGACCAALVLPKQANLVLFALLAIGLAAAAERMPRRLVRLVPAAAFALVPYLVWRVQVAAMGGGGEQAAVPFAKWQFDVLPETLASMGHVIINKGGYFGLGVVLCLVAAVALLRGPRAEQRLAVVFAAVFTGFTVFLLWVYVAVYIGYEGISAASFWRYHTELGGLELAAAAAVAGGWWRAAGGRLPRPVPRAVAALCLAVALAGPVAGARYLRFDIHPVKDHVRRAVVEMTRTLPAGATLFVIDPKGPGFFPKFIDWYMGFGRQVVGGLSAFTPDSGVAPELAATPATHLYLLTWNPAVEAALGRTLRPDASHLFARAGDGWTLVKSWPFTGFTAPGDFKY